MTVAIEAASVVLMPSFRGKFSFASILFIGGDRRIIPRLAANES